MDHAEAVSADNQLDPTENHVSSQLYEPVETTLGFCSGYVCTITADASTVTAKTAQRVVSENLQRLGPPNRVFQGEAGEHGKSFLWVDGDVRILLQTSMVGPHGPGPFVGLEYQIVDARLYFAPIDDARAQRWTEVAWGDTPLQLSAPLESSIATLAHGVVPGMNIVTLRAEYPDAPWYYAKGFQLNGDHIFGASFLNGQLAKFVLETNQSLEPILGPSRPDWALPNSDEWNDGHLSVLCPRISGSSFRNFCFIQDNDLTQNGVFQTPIDVPPGAMLFR